MKAATIKDVTKEELYEYFQYVRGAAKNSVWSKGQVSLIGETFCEEQLILRLIARMKAEAPPEFTIMDSYLSMVIYGFQCGREFEYRQMVKAMRGGAEK